VISSRPPATRLVGRGAEQALIAARLDNQDGGAAILVRGPAGIGKSALVDDAVRQATPATRILRAAGAPPETGMAMAGLYQLLQPLLPLAHLIPEPRQVALRVAFGIVAGPPPEPFALAMAALDLLVDAAAEQPLLIVAEDLQWLDSATLGVLRFIARRVQDDPIVLLATARDDEPDPLAGAAGWVLDLQPLGADDARRLLASVAPELRGPAQAAMLRAAEGNPLALVELPKTPGLILPSAGNAGWQPLTQRLQAAFAARVERLPPATRSALTLLALHDSGSLEELLVALGQEKAPAPLQVLEPAIAADLLQLSDGQLRFSHGLMRSAVYNVTSPSGRVAGHLALARAVGPGTDRGILHRARAATGHDEAIAAELELAAERAARRGAVHAAVTALARGAELTASAPRKRRYLFRAATLAYELGQVDAGDAHRAVLALLADDEHSRLLLEELAEIADVSASGGRARLQALIGLAERSRLLGDDRLAGSFLYSAAYRCWTREPATALAPTIIRLATDWAHSLGEARRGAMLAFADPIGSAAAVSRILDAAITTELDSVSVQNLGHAASCIGDFELADTLYVSVVSRLRAEGRVQALARALDLQAWARLRRGQWSTAMPLAEEGSRLAAESGQPEWEASGLAAQAMVAALRGEIAAAATAADRAERIAGPGHMTVILAISLLARATGAAAEGDFSSAWNYLSRMHREADPAFHPVQALWSLSHLAYAALHCDRVEPTRELAKQLIARLPSAPTGPTARMNLLYANALLAPDDLVEERVRAALDHEVGNWPFERSRMQLLLGSRLRRDKRVQESREMLRAARIGFDSLGAALWADRAADELRAAGEPSHPAADVTWNSLSAQELQVARMVAEGLSNRQIGERLYLSHRTVASHLYHIFPKLGISSRAQLTAMSLDLPASPPLRTEDEVIDHDSERKGLSP
jgi:DNA-binding CsgD family transcriptional regulator